MQSEEKTNKEREQVCEVHNHTFNGSACKSLTVLIKCQLAHTARSKNLYKKFMTFIIGVVLPPDRDNSCKVIISTWSPQYKPMVILSVSYRHFFVHVLTTRITQDINQKLLQQMLYVLKGLDTAGTQQQFSDLLIDVAAQLYSRERISITEVGLQMIRVIPSQVVLHSGMTDSEGLKMSEMKQKKDSDADTNTKKEKTKSKAKTTTTGMSYFMVYQVTFCNPLDTRRGVIF